MAKASSINAISQFIQRCRARLGDLWWYTLLAFIVHRLGEVVNLVIGLWIVPKYLPADQLGAVLPLMSVGAFVGFPIAIALLPVGKFLNVFATNKEYGKVKALLIDSCTLSILFAIGIAIWLFVDGDAILERMHVTDRRIFIPVAGFAIITCIDPIIQSAQRALKCFNAIVLSGFIAPYVRLIFMLLLLPGLGALGYLSAQLAMSLSGVLIGIFVICRILFSLGKRESYIIHWREMLAYSMPLLVLTLAARVQMPVETFVIRHRLPLDVSAGYYYSTMFGSIPGYMTSALLIVLSPILSERFEKGQSTEKLFIQSIAMNLFVGLASLVLVALVVPYVFRLPGPWVGYEEYSKYVWHVGLIAVIKGLQNIFMTHENACRRFRYIWYIVPLYLIEAGVIYSLPAWHAFQPYLPYALWNWINVRWVLSLQSILILIIAFNAIFLIAMTVEWYLRRCLSVKGSANYEIRK